MFDARSSSPGQDSSERKTLIYDILKLYFYYLQYGPRGEGKGVAVRVALWYYGWMGRGAPSRTV